MANNGEPLFLTFLKIVQLYVVTTIRGRNVQEVRDAIETVSFSAKIIFFARELHKKISYVV